MTMTNPFEELGAGKKSVPDFELVGGALTCQYPGCWEVVHEGKYIYAEAVLTWKCSQEHISHIKDFQI